jgi:hypothetical protein
MQATLRSRFLATLVAAAALALAPSPTAAQNRPEPLKRVRALLVIDTNTNLTEVVKISRDRMLELLRGSIPAANLDLVVFEGDQVTPENVLEHYRKLEVGPDDCLFFYFDGHGGWDRERGHVIGMGQPARLLYRSDLLAALKAKNAGLTVCLTDCCSNYLDAEGARRGRRPVPPVRPANALAPLVQHLFFQHRGVVDITAAEPGTYAWGNADRGSMFTCALSGLLAKTPADLDGDRDGFVTWDEFFKHLREQTNAVFQEVQESNNVPREERKTQFPHAFSLGGGAGGRRPVAASGYRLGARVQAGAQGMKIERVTPGSPAARLGLEAGDVILSVNGQPVRNQADYARLLDQGGGRVRLEILNGRDGKKVVRDNVMLEPVR